MEHSPPIRIQSLHVSKDATMTLTRLSQFLAGLLVLANLGFSTGCSALMGQKIKVPTSNLDMDSLKASGYRPGMATAPVQESEDGRPSVILEVHDGKKHLERIPLPSDKPTYIADIVRDAKLIETLGRIDLSIMRPTTEKRSSGPHAG